MKRGQVWIRASNAEGTKWGTVDVLDLDDDSFRVWVVDKLALMGRVIALRVDGEDIPLRAKEDVVVD